MVDGNGFGPSRAPRNSIRQAPYGTSGAKGRGSKPTSAGASHNKLCSLHKKMRTASVLESDGCGGFVCSPGSECKVSGAAVSEKPTTIGLAQNQICSLHNKMRGASALRSDGRGGYECHPEVECKLSGMNVVNENKNNKLCSLHNKMRSASALETDGCGGYVCARGVECKLATEPVGLAEKPSMKDSSVSQQLELCSLHQKMRSMNALETDGCGGFACTPESECKISSAITGPGELLNFDNSHHQERCSIHNKMRAVSALETDGHGGFACAPETECKLSGMPAEEPLGAAVRHQELCSLHDKMRTASALETDGRGGYQCRPEAECKTSAMIEQTKNPKTVPNSECGTALCSIHNKKRSRSSLENNGMGGFQCVPEFECRGAAAVGNGYRQETKGDSRGTCILHQRLRSMVSLTQTSVGFCCVKGSECKVGAEQVLEHQHSKQPKSHGEVKHDKFLCETHQKYRSVDSLVQQRDGSLVCSSESACKVKQIGDTPNNNGSTQFLCSVHDKLRTSSCLEDDGTGGKACLPHSQCKVSKQ